MILYDDFNDFGVRTSTHHHVPALRARPGQYQICMHCCCCAGRAAMTDNDRVTSEPHKNIGVMKDAYSHKVVGSVNNKWQE
jgi:hypothetical protein